MENIMIPANWQLPLSLSATFGRATSALWTLGSQGIAARPTPATGAFAPFAAAVVDTDIDAVKRDRAVAGMDHTCINAVYVPGSLAWSPPI
jgi:hypothetical protein